MTLQEIKAAVDGLAWQEHVEFEVGEDSPAASAGAENGVACGLHRLGQALTPDLLDALQAEPGYTAWALRLSPHVPGDRPRARARRFIADPDRTVRFWAAEIIFG